MTTMNAHTICDQEMTTTTKMMTTVMLLLMMKTKTQKSLKEQL
jgi:hypothetical protein